MEEYDVVVVGAGSAGENVAKALAAAGKRVAVVEGRHVGGECPFVACVPSKAMLRSAEVRLLVKHAHAFGAVAERVMLDAGDAAYAAAVSRRDRIAAQTDADGVRLLEEAGVTLLRGWGQATRPGVLLVGEVEVGWRDLVVATGSGPLIPPIPGLDDVPAWTSDEALKGTSLPASLAILGGGPVGCELAQVFAAFGSAVTVIDLAPRLLPQEEPAIGELLARALARDGVAFRLDTEVKGARREGDAAKLTLSKGHDLRVERVLVATGRTPRTAGLGLDALGIEPGKHGIAIDNHCRVVGQEHVWAAGDVAGIQPFTHTAEYQARVIVENLLGGTVEADYRSIPRMVYTNPPVASVGLTLAQAKEAGIDAVTATASYESNPRAETSDAGPGELHLVADRSRGVLVGASAIGDQADSWLGEALLAIHAAIPIGTFKGVIHAFPTFNQLYDEPLRELARKCGQGR